MSENKNQRRVANGSKHQQEKRSTGSIELEPKNGTIVTRKVKFVDLSGATDEKRSAKPAQSEAPKKRQLQTFASMKEMKEDTKEALQSVKRDRFRNWTKFELVELFIGLGIELRHEKQIPRAHLMALANSLFEDAEMPKSPPVPTVEMARKREKAAMLIQQLWIAKNIKKNNDKMLRRMMSDPHGNQRPPEEFERFIPQESREEMLETSRSQAMSRRMMEPENKPMVETKRQRDPNDWHPPSWEYAKAYGDYNNPRKYDSELGLLEYDVMATTTGRHCVIAGCGEQCDLWDEGQTSEFGQFGPGITNYFKFIKWCGWVFAVLTVISLPQIWINMIGPGQQSKASDMSIMARTTIGNLGDSFNSSTVEIPGCSNTQSHASNCILEKEDIAVFYGYSDLLMTLFVLIAYAWLRYFEIEEAKMLEDNTVAASSYTIMVPDMDPETSEEEIKKHFQDVTGVDIVDVAFGYNNAELISFYKKRGECMRKKHRISAEIRLRRTLAKRSHENYDDEIDFLEEERNEMILDIEEIEREIRTITYEQQEPLCAYITFEQDAGVVRSLVIYHSSWASWIFMKDEYRFKGQRLRVKKAPEPSTIMWEHLQFSSLDRFRRRLTSWSLAIVSLIVSIVVSFFASEYQQQAKASGGDAVCPSGWESLTDEEQRQAVSENDEIVHCYCSQMSLVDQGNDSACQNYLGSQMASVFSTVVCSAVVVLMNSLLTMLLRKMARYEKHHSIESEETSMFRRLFMIKFLNTGGVPLLLTSETLMRIIGVQISAWFTTAGVSLMIIMIFNVIGGHVAPLYRYYCYAKKMKAARDDPTVAITQEELNELHIGPEFHMSLRYAQLLVIFVVCWMYSSGIPLMFGIGAFSFFITYWIDKYLFLRFYRTPPRYNIEIGRESGAIIPWIACFHLGMSIWIYGNKRIFQSDEVGNTSQAKSYGDQTMNETVYQKSTFPLFVLLCCLFGLLFCKFFSSRIINIVRKIAQFVVCGGGVQVEKLLALFEQSLSVRFSYSQAYNRGLIRGLANYNILQNPKYKEAFAISDEFALMHKHVPSIRRFNAGVLSGIASMSDVTQQMRPKKNMQPQSAETSNYLPSASRRTTPTNDAEYGVPRPDTATRRQETKRPGAGRPLTSQSDPSASPTTASVERRVSAGTGERRSEARQSQSQNEYVQSAITMHARQAQI